MVFIRTEFNYDMNKAGDESGLKCLDASRTQQSFKEECDINTIVRRFGVTGEVPASIKTPLQGDFADAMNFQESMDQIVAAREAFQAMPSGVRKRFHHDPGEFVEFVSDASNRAEAEKLGLIVPPPPPTPEPAPQRVIVVPGPIPDNVMPSKTA